MYLRGGLPLCVASGMVHNMHTGRVTTKATAAQFLASGTVSYTLDEALLDDDDEALASGQF